MEIPKYSRPNPNSNSIYLPSKPYRGCEKKNYNTKKVSTPKKRTKLPKVLWREAAKEELKLRPILSPGVCCPRCQERDLLRTNPGLTCFWHLLSLDRRRQCRAFLCSKLPGLFMGAHLTQVHLLSFRSPSVCLICHVCLLACLSTLPHQHPCSHICTVPTGSVPHPLLHQSLS